jgi:hypothetical protein
MYVNTKTRYEEVTSNLPNNKMEKIKLYKKVLIVGELKESLKVDVRSQVQLMKIVCVLL